MGFRIDNEWTFKSTFFTLNWQFMKEDMQKDFVVSCFRPVHVMFPEVN